MTAGITAGDAALLLVAGVGAGLSGTIAGLASLISYPALLAIGLAPTTANVTNTVALVGVTAGSIAGSQPELRGRMSGVRRLLGAAAIGGVAGAALLLLTPTDSFERVVPWLIAVASMLIIVPPGTFAKGSDHRAVEDVGPGVVAAVAIVSIYGGYFGAGAGVMVLGLLLHATSESLPRANAVKAVILGVANGVAAIAFAVFGDVDWIAALVLGVGLVIGGRIGPIVVRRSAAGPLRVVIAVAGLGLAIKLGVDAYG